MSSFVMSCRDNDKVIRFSRQHCVVIITITTTSIVNIIIIIIIIIIITAPCCAGARAALGEETVEAMLGPEALSRPVTRAGTADKEKRTREWVVMMMMS
jgi:hypothetical protein